MQGEDVQQLNLRDHENEYGPDEIREQIGGVLIVISGTPHGRVKQIGRLFLIAVSADLYVS